jgi:hypothetical protein
MARRGTVKIKILEPDPIYGSRVVTKLINRSMRDGKKSVARTQIYEAMDIIKEKMGDDPLILNPQWKSEPRESGARPTRFRLRSVVQDANPWQSAG